MKSFLILSLIFILSSCSGYINQMHREFDRADGKVQRKSDQFSKYRKEKMKQAYGAVASTTSNPYVVPAVKREYRSLNRRIKSSDLEDNQGDGSLWSGVGERNNFLFTLNREKKNGDIVLIQVEAKLKNDITNELKRAFPQMLKKPASEETKEGEQAPAQTAQAPAAPAAGEKESEEDKTYDRISSVVVEEISRDHILLRGRKNVLFHERKRTVEVQALVSRKDINLDDSVMSDRIIESNVTVLR